MFDLSKLEKHTSKQVGLVTRAQALGEGLSASSIARAIQSELLIPVFRGVYRVRETPVTPKLMRRAALLWAGEGAVLSHVTAGLMWKLDGLGQDAAEVIWVSVPPQRNLRPPPSIRVVRAKGLRKGRKHLLVDGLPCTSLNRTVVDLARTLTGESLEMAFDSAERRELTSRRGIRAILLRLGLRGRQGAGALLELLEHDDLSATGSPLEVQVRRVLRAAKIPPPMPQLQITDSKTGNLIGVVDFAWPEHRVVIEADGWRDHQKKSRFNKDRANRSDLVADGWAVIQVTKHRLTTDREGFLDNVRRLLGLGDT